MRPEAAAVAELLRRGFNVARPFRDTGCDLWIEHGPRSRILRAQIKTAHWARKSSGRRFPNLTTDSTGSRLSLQEVADRVDFFIVYDAGGDQRFWIIPSEEVRAHRSKSGGRAKGQIALSSFGHFVNAWDRLGAPNQPRASRPEVTPRQGSLYVD